MFEYFAWLESNYYILVHVLMFVALVLAYPVFYGIGYGIGWGAGWLYLTTRDYYRNWRGNAR